MPWEVWCGQTCGGACRKGTASASIASSAARNRAGSTTRSCASSASSGESCLVPRGRCHCRSGGWTASARSPSAGPASQRGPSPSASCERGPACGAAGPGSGRSAASSCAPAPPRGRGARWREATAGASRRVAPGGCARASGCWPLRTSPAVQAPGRMRSGVPAAPRGASGAISRPSPWRRGGRLPTAATLRRRAGRAVVRRPGHRGPAAGGCEGRSAAETWPLRSPTASTPSLGTSKVIEVDIKLN
mmetsp:Transcript_22413/g.63608  ORF Transcript_22413/g.63608 Transcript_22413/m.63608 type:complete len:247 (-) Transcript_22413:145-885(-)